MTKYKRIKQASGLMITLVIKTITYVIITSKLFCFNAFSLTSVTVT